MARMKLYRPVCNWEDSFEIIESYFDKDVTIRNIDGPGLMEFSENYFGRHNEYRFRTTSKGILIVDPEDVDQLGNEYPYGELRY